MNWPVVAVAAVAGLVLGFAVPWVLLRFRRRSMAEERARTLADARAEADRVRKDADIKAKAEALKIREAAEHEAEEGRRKIANLERRVVKQEEAVEKRADAVARKEKFLENTQKRIEFRLEKVSQKTEQLRALIEQEKETLQSVSGLTKEDAEKMLLARLEKELERESADLISKSQEKSREMADEKARDILAQAIQRIAAEHTAEQVVSAVDIPNDDMKGRIIGREGRNIRAFEKATGTDVIVDDTPGVVVVSAFDSVRRDVGRRSLERLIADGRIHPARIEEVVAQTKKEVEEQIRETGKKACYDLDLHGLHPRLVQMLGRLHYRSAAGQNVLLHSTEVAMLAGLVAAELKVDVALARRSGLLHDIGRALDHDVEGSHAIAGADFARRCEEKKEVVNAIAAHHDEVKPDNVYAVLTQVANRIANSRPGTKREQLEKFIKRMERLEEVANSFLGVERAFAIQAGREVRVIANAQRVDDRLAIKVCRDIARQIETELSYPGEVRVTLIRETRVIEYAM